MIKKVKMEKFKVIVKNPMPEVPKGDAFEDTMLLIDMMKHQKELNNYEKKVNSFIQ